MVGVKKLCLGADDLVVVSVVVVEYHSCSRQVSRAEEARKKET